MSLGVISKQESSCEKGSIDFLYLVMGSLFRGLLVSTCEGFSWSPPFSSRSRHLRAIFASQSDTNAVGEGGWLLSFFISFLISFLITGGDLGVPGLLDFDSVSESDDT
jgi:hypothetical protein